MTKSQTCSGVVIRPACVDITVQRGTDNPIEVVLTDGDGKAVDLTPDTATMTVRKSLAGNLVFQKSNGPGSHIDPVNGRTLFEIEKTDIDDEASETLVEYWVYEIRRITGTDDERVHLAGAFVVEPTVTA